MISTEISKVIVLLTLFTTTFVFSMIPLKLFTLTQNQLDPRRRRIYKAGISLLNCFAAGVFLGTCLLDLFPEVQENLQTAHTALQWQSKFPLAEFILVVGFISILLIEQIVLTVKQSHDLEQQRLLAPDSQQTFQSYGATSDHPSSINRYPSSETDPYSSSVDLSESFDGRRDNEDEEEKRQPYSDPSSNSVIRSVILVIALSVHSLFEGLAVGLQPTVNDVLQIFAALALHKSIIAFSLGLNMVQSTLGIKTIIRSNLFFSITSPTGIAIGIGVAKLQVSEVTSCLINGVLEGIACGTFVYIVFFEILPREFMRKRYYPSRLLKILMLLIGYSFMVAIIFVDPTTS